MRRVLIVRLFSLVAACFVLALFGVPVEAQVYSENGAPKILGAKNVPRGLDLCNDYGSRLDYSGAPYRIVEPDRVVTRHEGIDFCARAGTPVIAPVSGKIVWSILDNPLRGGQVLIKTNFRIKTGKGNRSKPVFIGMIHITPNANLKRGSRVTAGQVIGVVRKAGLVEIGSRPHVHFTARDCDETHKCHFDPNFLWQNGPGKVSCYRPGSDVPKGRIVAPLSC